MIMECHSKPLFSKKQWSYYCFSYTVLTSDYSTNISQSKMSANCFWVTVSLFSQSSEIIQYSILHIAVVKPKWSTFEFSFSYCLVLVPVVSPCVFHFHSALISINDVLRNVVWRAYHIIRWCVAVAALKVSILIAFTYITAYAINFFSRRVGEFFCDRLSFSFVDFVATVVHRVVWRVLSIALRDSHRWRQCDLVDWFFISDSLFIYRDSRQWKIYYLMRAYLRTRISLYDSFGTCTAGEIFIGGRSS